jgi:hypothetical protein
MPTLDSVKIEVINALDQISVNSIESTSTVQLEENSTNLVVELSTIDPTALVRSVNGKTGNVVIDYPDIGANPVNNVRFVHTQASVPTVQASGTYAGLYIWTINHNLNFYPNITVFGSGNSIVETHVAYSNANTAIIIMNSAISGTAYLS